MNETVLLQAVRRGAAAQPRRAERLFPLLGLAAAHFFAGHFEETVALTSRILAEVPTHNVARRYRAAALGHLSRLDEAGAVIAELQKAQSNSNLRSSRSSVLRDPCMWERTPTAKAAEAALASFAAARLRG